MQQADTNSGPPPLPLFRAEAMAARQQSAQGEILLIRPFSLVFLCWLGVAVAAATLGFLFFGHATQSRWIEGTITTQSSASLQAAFQVPESQTQTLTLGHDLVIRCETCSQTLTGRIVSISRSTAAVSSGSHDLYSTVTAVLPAQEHLQPGVRVKAQIQLGKKSLLAWLLEKPGQ
jgi:multidrug efflux pump subunit AcrA (membrane-fusion protein)